MRSLTYLPVAALLLTPIASAQAIPVLTETFEYPIGVSFHGTPGAQGWSNNWFVDGANNDAYLTQDNSMAPSFSLSDGVGGHAVQQWTWQSAYRQIDLAAHPDLIDLNTNMWGRDGAIFWVSFSIEKYGGSGPDRYMGLSLWKAGQTFAEAVLLGSGWGQDEWGSTTREPRGGRRPGPRGATRRSLRGSSTASTASRATSGCACGSTPRCRIPPGRPTSTR